ncbi:MAG: hypothetical protein LBQ12_16230 [Deltaproteobacteria bacterium]|jgi:hypothetical protein|nr:hypothetical protein [Deltaproteobacteria bacterium]
MKPKASFSHGRAVLSCIVIFAALIAAVASYAQSSGSASAQTALAIPRAHDSYMQDPSYRDAYETCAAFLEQAMKIPGVDKASLAEAVAPEANSPEGAGAWTDRFKLVTVKLAAALQGRIPEDPEAPLQGYYVYLGETDSGGMTVAKVGAGPAYGVSVTTFFRSNICNFERVGMKPLGDKLTLPLDEFDEPGTPAIEITFNGSEAVLGPDFSAVQSWCGLNATAVGSYIRAK